eukprot:1257088-Rhodomonas_salina.1
MSDSGNLISELLHITWAGFKLVGKAVKFILYRVLDVLTVFEILFACVLPWRISSVVSPSLPLPFPLPHPPWLDASLLTCEVNVQMKDFLEEGIISEKTTSPERFFFAGCQLLQTIVDFMVIPFALLSLGSGLRTFQTIADLQEVRKNRRNNSDSWDIRYRRIYVWQAFLVICDIASLAAGLLCLVTGNPLQMAYAMSGTDMGSANLRHPSRAAHF